jgi:opacity protein-like surface antigen
MLKKLSLLVTVIALSAAPAVMADQAPQHPWHPVAALDAGYAFMNTSTQSTGFTPYGTEFFNLRDNGQNYSQKMYGGFAGIEMQVKPLWAVQMGLGYYSPVSMVARGNESQGVIGSPETYDSFTYRYTITLKQFLAEGKLLYTWHDKYMPFVLAGMGVTFNQVRGYGINYPAFLTFAPEFTNRNSAAFTWRGGFGLDYATSPDLRLGLGYYFSDFGKVQTGTGHVDTYGTRTNLQQPTLFTNELVAQMTMIF